MIGGVSFYIDIQFNILTSLNNTKEMYLIKYLNSQFEPYLSNCAREMVLQ